MILGADAIREAMEAGRLVFQRSGRVLDSRELGIEPASVDLTLASDWLIPRPNAESDFVMTDLRKPIEYHEESGSVICVPARGFVLARTRESITLPADLVAFVEGRSSVGRAGLFIHNAGWVDPGFQGTITLELFNALPNPILVPAGMRICQLVVAETKGCPIHESYKGKYQGQEATTGSRLWQDFR